MKLFTPAVEREVTRAHSLKPLARGGRGGEWFEDREQGLLGGIEVAHVVPERVVGIEADEFDRHALV